jgi:acyl-CoA thioester hydrolase
LHTHILPIRIYYEDTDAGGIVYHANYLKFFERARVESLRSLGFELTSLLHNDDAQFVVSSVQLEYLQSAHLDQLLYVVTEITEVRGASIRYKQSLCSETTEGTLYCQAHIRLACLNSQKRPRRLPGALLLEIKK